MNERGVRAGPLSAMPTSSPTGAALAAAATGNRPPDQQHQHHQRQHQQRQQQQRVYIPPAGASSLVSMAHFCPGLHGPGVRKDAHTGTFRAFLEELHGPSPSNSPHAEQQGQISSDATNTSTNSREQLVIPLFQRAYCWPRALTMAWWRDVTRAAATTAAASARRSGTRRAGGERAASTTGIVAAASAAPPECHRVGIVVLKRWDPDAAGGGGGGGESGAAAGGGGGRHPHADVQPQQQQQPQPQQVYVLDGQQRLTTTALLVAALRDAALRLASTAGLRSMEPSQDDDGEAFALKELVAGLERCLCVVVG